MPLMLLFRFFRLYAKIFLQLLDIHPAHITQNRVFLCDIANFHAITAVLQCNSSIIRTVETAADDAGTEGIAIQPLHQIEHRGAVCRLNDSCVIIRAVDLLCKVEGAFIPLLKRQAGILFEFCKVNGFTLCKRMPFPQVHIYAAVHQLMELQMIRLKELLHHMAVEITQVENADLAFLRADILNDLAGLVLVWSFYFVPPLVQSSTLLNQVL